MNDHKFNQSENSSKSNHFNKTIMLLYAWGISLLNAVSNECSNAVGYAQMNKHDEVNRLRKSRKISRSIVRMTGKSIQLKKCTECDLYFYETDVYTINELCIHSLEQKENVRLFDIDYFNTKKSAEGLEVIKAPPELMDKGIVPIEEFIDLLGLQMKKKE